jgi:predicted DNA-binding transcriptional regulator AlpA
MSSTTIPPRKAANNAATTAAHRKAAAQRRKRLKSENVKSSVKSVAAIKRVEEAAEEVPNPKFEKPPVKLLTKAQVLDRIGLTFPTVWKLMRQNRFPRSRVVGDSKSVWLESEITEWILALPERQLLGDEA